MDIVFKGRHTEVLERFRSHARAKLARIVRLDSRVARIDVEVSTERNPRPQAFGHRARKIGHPAHACVAAVVSIWHEPRIRTGRDRRPNALPLKRR